MNVNWKYLAGGAVILVVLAFALWFVFLRPHPTTLTGSSNLFGQSQNQPVPTITEGPSTASDQQSFVYAPNSQKKIFKISDGPIASATYIETTNPTTTVVRYIRQDSGHVFEQPLDAPGSAMRLISDTTIPGIQNAVWTQKGNSVIVQYAEQGTIKTASVLFSSNGSSTPQIRFLPDNIASIAASPDGSKIVFLMSNTNGTNGYVANPDGTGSKLLFTSELSQLKVSWPSLNEILLQTLPASGVPGMAFSVSTKTGVISPLLYADDLTLTVNGDFSSIMYQTDANGVRRSYDHETATGKDTPLSGQPIPEKCAWSYVVRSALICAVPDSAVPVNYLDLWHMGLASVPDTIVGYNFDSHTDVAIATPGNPADGGNKTDVALLSVSPDGNHVLYIAKGSRSLWGINLNQ